MALDLSALEHKNVLTIKSDEHGKPLLIDLDTIEEDPDQPRKEFSKTALNEMTQSIISRGVKTPISIRRHPTKKNSWILNYGARRLRASITAGFKTIPAFIDEAHDDYDQVIENIQRDDLKPMELALFIKKRLDAGDTKKSIAQKLGKDATMITHHLALIDPPSCVEDAYANSRCTSPKTLYELRSLYDQFPEQVSKWYATDQEITRKAIANLSVALKYQTREISPSPSPINADKKFEKRNKQTFLNQSAKNDSTISLTESDALTNKRITKPCIMIEMHQRTAEILLNLLPTTTGKLWIRYQDTCCEIEVDASLCTICSLTDTVG